MIITKKLTHLIEKLFNGLNFYTVYVDIDVLELQLSTSQV